MDAVLVIIATLVAGAPIIAAVIVSLASRREDEEWTLGHPKVGPIPTIARRILDFRTDSVHDGGIAMPHPRGNIGARAERKSRTPSGELEPGQGAESARAQPGWLVDSLASGAPSGDAFPLPRPARPALLARRSRCRRAPSAPGWLTVMCW